MQLFEQVRPRAWNQVIGQSHIVQSIARMKDRGSLGGHAYWLTGPSGTGKTTIAYLIAGEICDPENFVELDAGEVTPAKLADLERSLRYRAIGAKQGRAVLVNEAHSLRQDAIRKFLVMLERIPPHAVFIFTTTDAGQKLLFDGIDARPLLSRCVQFRLESPADAFAERAKEIAEAEGLDGRSIAEYRELARDCEGNFRMMLSRIEAGEMVAGSPAPKPLNRKGRDPFARLMVAR